jgi:hypothetical protein
MREAFGTGRSTVLTLKPDDGGRSFIRNIGTYLLTIDHHISEDHKFDIFTIMRTSVLTPNLFSCYG